MDHESPRERRLRELFSDVGFQSGGEFYVPAAAGALFVEQCGNESMVIVGVEVFTRLRDDRLQPNLGLIADFSSIVTPGKPWAALVHQSVDEARQFLGGIVLRGDCWLNFTLLTEEEATAAGEPD